MADYSNELIAKLKKAQSLEEVTGILEAGGQDVSKAEKLWDEIKTMREGEDAELSIDELEAVSGGARNWLEKGCAATVEPDSECWGTDGGCEWWNVKYKYAPEDDMVCPFCGAYPVGKIQKRHPEIWQCRKCGARFQPNWGNGTWADYVKIN